MVEGRQKDLWAHTSSLMALTANCNRDPKKKAFAASDFDPFHEKKVIRITKNNISDLKAEFVGK